MEIDFNNLNGSFYGKMIAKYMKDGNFTPTEFLEQVMNWMEGEGLIGDMFDGIAYDWHGTVDCDELELTTY